MHLATSRPILYGTPPTTLVSVAHNFMQCSPLILGSHQLADLAPASVESATLYAPASSIERRYVLARMLRALAVGGSLTALAPKDKGGTRLAAELTAFGCMVVDTARHHHRIVTTTRPTILHGLDDAIAAGDLQQHPRHGLWTQPGIFSWDAIDAGSALLRDHLPPLAGMGADMGAGLGVLSLATLQSPTVTSLTLIDIDRRAIHAAKRNLTDPRAHFLWADIRAAQNLPQNLDFVVMNPPFHDAGIEDKTLGHGFIRRAALMLKPDGRCWLVANRHLPYEALLSQCFSRNRMVVDAAGFKIFESVK